jgi:hypothetical protein
MLSRHVGQEIIEQFLNWDHGSVEKEVHELVKGFRG